MKKLLTLKIILTIVPIILAIAVYLIFFNTTYLKRVIIEDETVNNSYNNYNANDEDSELAKIGNKLYYNYYNFDPLKSGTYEISNHITKRIYTNGYITAPNNLFLDIVGDDKILSDVGQGKLEFYNIEKKEFEPYFSLDDKYLDESPYWDTFFINENQYWYSSEGPAWCSTGYNIYKYEGEKMNYVFSTDVINKDLYGRPQFDGNYIYFDADDEKDNDIINSVFCKYDISTKKIIDQMQVDMDNYFTCDIVANDKIYGSGVVYDEKNDECDYYICVADMKTKTQKKILSTTGTAILNGYGDLVCVGVNESAGKNGLYVIDTNTDKVKRIYDKQGVYEVYIVDSTWIYFTDESEKLYRITPNGNVLEKVFG